MYNNQYEEYMRNSLGYNMPMMNMNQMDMNQMNMNQMNMNEMYESENNFSCSQVVEDMYPEIYRIIYPMVCKACMVVDENISEDLVSRMVNEIYMNVENMEAVQECRGSSISVSPQASKSSKSDSLSSSSRTGSSLSSSSSSSSSSNSLSSVRQETRQRNPLLRDIIRILVLRELIGNPGRPRPPFRPPFRPPYGGGMGPGQGPRPPFGPGPRSPYEY